MMAWQAMELGRSHALAATPASAIVTEVQVRPVPMPTSSTQPEHEVKPKAVVAKKPKNQPEQRWFW